MGDAPEQSLGRKLGLTALAVAAVLLLAEGLASWGAALLAGWERSAPVRPERAHAMHDAELGWVNVPDLSLPDLYGPGRDFTTDARGFRVHAPVEDRVPSGRARVLYAGDSFTMGVGVGDLETFPAQVERLEPRLQAVNLGMGAYGVGQAYLAYLRDGDAVEADALVFAFIAHDFDRMLLDHYMAPKPRLAVREGELVVENQPVPEADGAQRWLRGVTQFSHKLAILRGMRRVANALPRPSSPDAPVLPFQEVAEQMFAELRQVAAERGHRVLLVYLPARHVLGQEGRVQSWVAEAAATEGLPFLDLTAEFEALSQQERHAAFLPDGHYSPAGNALVAEAVADALAPRLLAPADG